jgi:hypothetical protein
VAKKDFLNLYFAKEVQRINFAAFLQAVVLKHAARAVRAARKIPKF